MRLPQPLARARAEPLAQVAPVALEPLERRAGPAHRGLAAQQVGEQRLVVGALGVRRLQRGQRLGVRSRSGSRPARGRPARPRRPRPPRARTRPSGPSSSRRREQPVGQRERLARERAAAAASRPARAAASRRARQPRGVDLGRADAEPVAGRVADDRVGSAGRARARDEHLQALRRVRGRVVAPDELDQPLIRNGPPPRRQRGEQRPRAVAGDGGSLPAHVVEQGQSERHRASLFRRAFGTDS